MLHAWDSSTRLPASPAACVAESVRRDLVPSALPVQRAATPADAVRRRRSLETWQQPHAHRRRVPDAALQGLARPWNGRWQAAVRWGHAGARTRRGAPGAYPTGAARRRRRRTPPRSPTAAAAGLWPRRARCCAAPRPCPTARPPPAATCAALAASPLAAPMSHLHCEAVWGWPAPQAAVVLLLLQVQSTRVASCSGDVRAQHKLQGSPRKARTCLQTCSGAERRPG